MINVLSVHHPWIVQPPAGYVALPTSRHSNRTRTRVRFQRRPESGPSRAQEVAYQNLGDIDEGATDSNLFEPIYVSSDESDDGHQMDWSDRVGSSNLESGVGLDRSRIDTVEVLADNCLIQPTYNVPVVNAWSPDRSMLMDVVISDSDPDSEGPDMEDDIYVTDVDSTPLLDVYVPDSDGSGELEEQEPDSDQLYFGVPLAVYMPGPDPNPASGGSAETRSSLGQDPITGQYTANSFGNFQADWLE